MITNKNLQIMKSEAKYIAEKGKGDPFTFSDIHIS